MVKFLLAVDGDPLDKSNLVTQFNFAFIPAFFVKYCWTLAKNWERKDTATFSIATFFEKAIKDS